MQPIRIAENGKIIEYGFDDLVKFHGFQFHCGLAIAYRAMQVAIPQLADEAVPDRRKITVAAAFQGKGALDAVEMVTRAVSGDRFGPYQGTRTRQEAPSGHFTFEFQYEDRSVCAEMRAGHIEPEFLDLARKAEKSPEELQRFAVVRAAMIEHMRTTPASEIFETHVTSSIRHG